jgi:hypothetical protein
MDRPSLVILRRLVIAGIVLASLLLVVIWTSSLIFLHLDGSVPVKTGLAIALIVGSLFLAWRKKWLASWRNVLLAVAALAAVYVWLAWDEPAFTHPLTLADLGPLPPSGAEESSSLTLRYSAGPGHPGGLPFKEPKLTIKVFDHDPKNPEAWPKELLAHRAEIDAAWDALAPERDWFAAMDRFELIGDQSSARFDAPIIKFLPLRTTIRLACARATLQATDGKGDEAVDLLLPYLRVGFKLEPASRSLVRSMVARSALGTTIRTASYVVAHSPVSVERKAQLAAVLEGKGDAAVLARRLLLTEYARTYAEVFNQREIKFGQLVSAQNGEGNGFVVRCGNGLDRLLFLRRASANLHANLAYTLADLAAKHDLKGFADQSALLYRQMNNAPLKNTGGVMAADIMLPSYQKVIEHFWTVDDNRTRLLAELKP